MPDDTDSAAKRQKINSRTKSSQSRERCVTTTPVNQLERNSESASSCDAARKRIAPNKPDPTERGFGSASGSSASKERKFRTLGELLKDTEPSCLNAFGREGSAKLVSDCGSATFSKAILEVSEPDDNESVAAFEPVLTNVNAAFSLGVPVCCKSIALSMRYAEYNPQNKSHGVILRNKAPRCTIRILASGKVSLTGARTVDDAKTTAKHITKLISKLGYPTVKCTQFTIDVMHAVAMVPFPIRLEQMAIDHCQHCIYEPECFSGLVYRSVSPQMSFRIYVSGKIIIDGAKNWDEITRGFDVIRSIVNAYRV